MGIDGNFTQLTASALKKFESDHRLTTKSGLFTILQRNSGSCDWDKPFHSSFIKLTSEYIMLGAAQLENMPLLFLLRVNFCVLLIML